MRFTLLLAFLCCTSTITSKLSIWEPKSLKSIYAHTEFRYTVMDFGSVPYGHSIYGTVFKATPYDACTELKPLEWDKNYGTLIVLLNRGGCNFSDKVLNAQKIGAGFVLIADNTDEDVHRIFPIERTKEQLDKVRIPSVLISKQEAENILKALSASEHKPHDTNETLVELAIHFDLTKSHDRSHMKIIVAVDDYRCYDLLLNFEPYRKLFARNIDYQLHFKLFFNSKQFFEDDDCIGPPEAHYCVSKSFGNSKKNLALPDETLKQLCLKNYDYDLFMKYIPYSLHSAEYASHGCPLGSGICRTFPMTGRPLGPGGSGNRRGLRLLRATTARTMRTATKPVPARKSDRERESESKEGIFRLETPNLLSWQAYVCLD